MTYFHFEVSAILLKIAFQSQFFYIDGTKEHENKLENCVDFSRQALEELSV